MRFEIYKLGNRHVLKTIKNGSMTRAVFFKDEEVNNVVEKIKLNGWTITQKEVMEA